MTSCGSTHAPGGRLFAASVATLFCALMLAAFPAAQGTPGQDTPPPDDPPAQLAIVEGTATLERDGQRLAAEENMPLLAGDRLRTDNGHIEILFGDGSVLDIDRRSSVDLLSDSLMRLGRGRVRLTIARVSEALNYRVDAAGASAIIATAGEYRLRVPDAATEQTLELDVVQGTADLTSPLGRTRVRAGRAAFASERTEPSLPVAFNSSMPDEFDRWADDQRELRLSAASSRYLPADLRSYGGALDRDGDWQYETDYGYVWYPRVTSTWEPYYDGRWSVVGSYGWVWIGANRWSWPTHHYGRWSVISNRWCWSPGRQWSPAWVSWAVSPGYVSWCPLGFDGRPAVSLVTSARFGPTRRGWTVVPERTFAGTVAVPRHTTAQPLAPGALSQFQLRSAGPRAATPRAQTEPLRAPSSRHSVVTPMTSAPTREVRSSREIAPVPTPPDRRSAPRGLTPPRPDVPETPSAPRSPGDPSRSRGGRVYPPDSSSGSDTTRRLPPPVTPAPPPSPTSHMRGIAGGMAPPPRPAPPPTPAPPPSSARRGNSAPPSPPPASSGSSSGAGSRSGSGSGTGSGNGSGSGASSRGRSGGSPPPSTAPPPSSTGSNRSSSMSRRGGGGGGA